jgi:phage terminase small subunit
MAGKAAGLNPRQQRFVEEYLVDLNATAAYIRAGYVARGNGAEVNASKLLRHPKVAEAIQAGMAARSARTGLTAKYVLESIQRLAENAEREGDVKAALKGHELLGKHLKLFVDKVEHSGELKTEIVVNLKTG